VPSILGTRTDRDVRIAMDEGLLLRAQTSFGRLRTVSFQ
jgi:hypothetical protein